MRQDLAYRASVSSSGVCRIYQGAHLVATLPAYAVRPRPGLDLRAAIVRELRAEAATRECMAAFFAGDFGLEPAAIVDRRAPASRSAVGPGAEGTAVDGAAHAEEGMPAGAA